MTMVYVPAGSFLMGSAGGDPWAQSDEKPQHAVTLDAFWIDQTEVTNAQYALCVAAGACVQLGFTNNPNFNEAEQPVVGVSWNDSDDYCRWAGGRLPTEAEWEYAAREPEGRRYPWGNEAPNSQRLNYNRNVGKTTPVGSYPAGASWVGTLDQAGNVWEWAADWYDIYRAEAQTNPTGPASGSSRVLRGGGWFDDAEGVRTTLRTGQEPDFRNDYLGFRCVISPAR
jgi:formylglycine-generating enzyme required for sulfatase activity